MKADVFKNFQQIRCNAKEPDMIPKIIHYCWLSSDPIPLKLEEYIKSWKEQLWDYEFMLWNFDRFDMDKSVWVKEAFENKKYAFAADYIRLYAVYNYGGIYLDMDVEVLSSFDPFLHLSSMICYEKNGDHLEMAAFGVKKHSSWIKECLLYYDKRSFIKDGSLDMKILPVVINERLALNFKLFPVNNLSEASQSGDDPYAIRILPSEFFSPKDYWTGEITLTANTVCVHHFSGSWLPSYLKIEARLCEYLGVKNLKIIERFRWKLRALKLKLIK
ncbi:MAG: glycosyltransferase family 32 protein [Daejeonella sp.]